jgi:hypothetical protein
MTVQFAYEHTESYIDGGADTADVDENGFADVAVFSGSRIRVWAQQKVDEGLRAPVLYYSSGVELDTDNLPPSVDLVVQSRKPPSVSERR